MNVGDKVVCVDVRPCWFEIEPKGGRRTPPLLMNQVYVVSGFGRVKYGPIVNVIGVDPSPHAGFHPARFRLLSEMKNEARLMTTIETKQPKNIHETVSRY